MIKHLYVNGCSFVNDHTIDWQFSDQIAQQRSWTVTNAGIPGSCNRRIIRRTLKDTLEFDQTTLVIVSLSQPVRTEINLYHPDSESDSEDFFHSVKLNSTDKRFKDYIEQWGRHYSGYGENLNLATDVLLLTSHFKLRNIPYLIYSYSGIKNPIIMPDLSEHAIFQNLKKDPRVMDLFTQCLCDKLGPGNWYYDGNPGHLNRAGHVRAAEILLELFDSTNQGN